MEIQMIQLTDTNIRDIKYLILGLDGKLSSVAKDVADLKTTAEELEISVTSLATRLTNIANRSNLKFNCFITIITALVGFLSTILVKTSFFP
jgi:hypothetical protein